MDTKMIELGFKKGGDLFVKNSPTILTALAVAGLATTVFLAMDARIKAEEILAEERAARQENDDVIPFVPVSKVDALKLTWKFYAPPAVMAMVTVSCIIGANAINLRRNAVLGALYSIADTGLKEYKAKVLETMGKNKAEMVSGAIAQDKLNANPVEKTTVIITPNGTTLCFDSLSARYFESSMEKIKKVQNDFNYTMFGEGPMSLNEFYQELGLEHTSLGDELGWSMEFGQLDINFSSKISTDERPCIVLDYRVGPRKLW